MESLTSEGTVSEIRDQWKRLWQERFDDKERAEGIANADYSLLFVEKGTVLFATRDFKSLDFGDILRQNKILDAHRFVSPSPNVGGWGKFFRTMMSRQCLHRTTGRARYYSAPGKRRQQLKKGGRGWLHI
jgi:hypothetical protein